MAKKYLYCGLLFLCCLIFAGTALSHSGRTDGSGGHRDNQNKSGLGGYHYHCGGYGPHLHPQGNCPYRGGSKANSFNSGVTPAPAINTYNTGNTKTSLSNTEIFIKIAQEKLNKKGYYCGTPDGSMGAKTIAAIRQFQKDNGLTVTGTLNETTYRKLMD